MILLFTILLLRIVYTAADFNANDYIWTTPGISVKSCDNVVGNSLRNEFCTYLCGISRSQYTYYRQCFDDFYYINKCFGRFNFWFEEDGAQLFTKIDLFYTWRDTVTDPRACQSKCQDLPNCYWFVYNGLGTKTDPYSDNKYNCYLMTLQDLVETNEALLKIYQSRPKAVEPFQEDLKEYFCLDNIEHRQRLVCHDFQLCGNWKANNSHIYEADLFPKKGFVVSGPEYCNFAWIEHWEDKFCPPLYILYEKLYPDAFFVSNFPRSATLAPGQVRVTKYLVRDEKKRKDRTPIHVGPQKSMMNEDKINEETSTNLSLLIISVLSIIIFTGFAVLLVFYYLKIKHAHPPAAVLQFSNE